MARNRNMGNEEPEEEEWMDKRQNSLGLVRSGIEKAIIQQNRGRDLEISDTLIFASVLTTLLSGADEYILELLQIFASSTRNAESSTVTGKLSVSCHFFAKFLETASDPKIMLLGIECSEALLHFVSNNGWQAEDVVLLMSTLLSLLTAPNQKATIKKQISYLVKNLLQDLNSNNVEGPSQLIGDALSDAVSRCTSTSEGTELIKILKIFLYLLPADGISSIVTSMLQNLVPLDLVNDSVRLMDLVLQTTSCRHVDFNTCKQIVLWLLDHAYSYDAKSQSIMVVTLSSAICYLRKVSSDNDDMSDVLENVTAVLFENSNDYDTLSAAKRLISDFANSDLEVIIVKLLSLLSYKNISSNNIGFTCNLIEFVQQTSEEARMDDRILLKMMQVLETARDLNLSLKSMTPIQKSMANIVALIGIEAFVSTHFPRDENDDDDHNSYPEYLGEVIHKSLLLETSQSRSLAFYKSNFSSKTFDYFQAYCKNVNDFDEYFGKFCPHLVTCLKFVTSEEGNDSAIADKILAGLIELLSQCANTGKNIQKPIANTLIRLVKALIEIFALVVDKHVMFSIHSLIKMCIGLCLTSDHPVGDHLSSILDQLIHAACVVPDTSNQSIAKKLCLITDFCQGHYVVSDDHQELIKTSIVLPIISSHRSNLYCSICDLVCRLPMLSSDELKSIVSQVISTSQDKTGVAQLLGVRLSDFDEDFLVETVLPEMIRSAKSSDRRCRDAVGSFFLSLTNRIGFSRILDEIVKLMMEPSNISNCVYVFVKLFSSDFQYGVIKAELDRLFPLLANIYINNDATVISDVWNDIIVLLIRFLNEHELQDVIQVVSSWLFGMLEGSKNSGATRPKLGIVIQVKNTLRKLIRKVGLDAVLAVTPEGHVALVMYIQKHDRKELRLKEQGHGGAMSTDYHHQQHGHVEEEEEEEAGANDKRKRRDDDDDDAPDDKIEWSSDGILQISLDKHNDTMDNKKQRRGGMNANEGKAAVDDSLEYNQNAYDARRDKSRNNSSSSKKDSREPRRVAVIGLNPKLAQSKRQATKRETRKEALQNFGSFMKSGKQFVKRNLN